ncbi:MAG TPA: Rieske 2Fe-2S domain-containing protein [Candidatus Baltobacteraceae bacterium]|jgi:nitrite reductase/ring-hydroxylating ferredoxin subunit
MSERSAEKHEDFVRLPEADRIPPGGSRAYTVGRHEVALFNIAGEFYALENSCPHQGAPIVDGWLEGSLVTCPWHAWCFDVRTGAMTLGEFATIDRYAVRRGTDGAVFVSREPIRS